MKRVYIFGVTIFSLLIVAIVLLLFVVNGFQVKNEDSTFSNSSDKIGGVIGAVGTPYSTSETVGTDSEAENNQTNCEFDLVVLPDKYNTGILDLTCLSTYILNSYGELKLYETDEKGIKLDFWSTPSLDGVYSISNTDFSAKDFIVSNENQLQNEITVVFTNCKFKLFNCGETSGKAKFVFNNCSFVSCYGSNMELNKCFISGGASDGIVPYENVIINSCYICDKSLQNTEDGKGAHTDGTQIYGSKKSKLSYNIHYYNCRFELPQLKNSSATLNSCVMLQMEFADANDISFEHCYVNGGGYAIYARSCYDYRLSDIRFTDIFVGCAARWGTYCPCDGVKVRDDGVVISNLALTNHLLIGTVWNECTTCYLSVSNDTSKDRTLLVKTDEGNKFFFIPACYVYDQIGDDTTFADYPFDMLLSIETVGKYVQCYDISGDSDILIRTYTMQ